MGTLSDFYQMPLPKLLSVPSVGFCMLPRYTRGASAHSKYHQKPIKSSSFLDINAYHLTHSGWMADHCPNPLFWAVGGIIEKGSEKRISG